MSGHTWREAIRKAIMPARAEIRQDDAERAAISVPAPRESVNTMMDPRFKIEDGVTVTASTLPGMYMGFDTTGSSMLKVSFPERSWYHNVEVNAIEALTWEARDPGAGFPMSSVAGQARTVLRLLQELGKLNGKIVVCGYRLDTKHMTVHRQEEST